MANFYFILLYILFCSVFAYRRSIIDCKRSTSDNSFLFFSMGLMLALNCLRGLEVGNDTLPYKNLFEYYIGHGTLFSVSDAGIRWMNEYVDIGYRTLNTLFARVSSSYQLFISVIAVFLYGTVSKFIKRESDNVCISVLLFFLVIYHPYMNVLRQAIAISVILIGFKHLKNHRYVLFSIYVGLAALFHKTAVITLLLVPLMRKRNFSLKKTLIVVAIVIGLTATNIVRRAVALIGYSGMYMNEEQGISTYAQILLSAVIFMLINYWRGNKLRNYVSGDLVNNETDLDKFYSRIPVVHLCLSIAGLNIPILYRCSYYFTIFYLTGIPHFVMNSKRSRNNLKVSVFLLLLTYIVYQTGVLIFRPEWFSEFSYKFFWQ